MHKIRMPRKSIAKIFRPVGQVVRSNRELLCVCDGLYFVIRFKQAALQLVTLKPHFRLVLKTDFRLVSTMYGIPENEMGYEDIFIPHQVVIHNKTATVSCVA